MVKRAEKLAELSERELALVVMDMFHRTILHHGLWFSQVEYQLGMKKTFELLGEVRDKVLFNQVERLGRVLGFETENGIPKALLNLSKEKLLELIAEQGKGWLAGDGIWFQTLENNLTMWDAKRCNDSCWAKFAPVEAWSIKNFLGLPRYAGLDGLKQALNFRLYSVINRQTVYFADQNSLIMEMNDCRVQSTRKKKGLADYPCKSAGIVEYRAFGEFIDERIVVECIGCPPDEHPPEWFCSWRFSLREI